MMIRRLTLTFIFVLLFVVSAHAQYAPVQNYCVLGAKQALTSGQPSSNFLQGVIPYCTVSVFNTGTITHSTIYSNSTGTVLTNPFQAANNGLWTFYAAPNLGYDVVLSGGFPPNTYTTPVTLVGQFPASGGAGCVGGGSVSDGCTGGTSQISAATSLGVFSLVNTVPQTAAGALSFSAALSTSGTTCTDPYGLASVVGAFFCEPMILNTPTPANSYQHQESAFIGGTAISGGVYNYNAGPSWVPLQVYSGSIPTIVSYPNAGDSNNNWNWLAVSPTFGVAPASPAWTPLARVGSKSSMQGMTLELTSITQSQNFNLWNVVNGLAPGEAINQYNVLYGTGGYSSTGGEPNENQRNIASQLAPSSPVIAVASQYPSGQPPLYVSGGTVVGTQGQNCEVVNLTNGNSQAVALITVDTTPNTFSTVVPLYWLNTGGTGTSSAQGTITGTLQAGYNPGNGSVFNAATSCSGTVQIFLPTNATYAGISYNSIGGIWQGQAGSFIPASSSTIIPVTATNASQSLSEGRFIRDWDAAKTITCNYTTPTSPTTLNTQANANPVYNIVTLAVSGCSQNSIPWSGNGPGGQYTTWNSYNNSPIGSGYIISVNAVMTISGGASGGLDATVPLVTSTISGGSGTVTTTICANYTSCDAPWPTNWPTSGTLTINAAAQVSGVNLDSSQHPVSFVTPDSSALISGGLLDQVAGYNSTFENEHGAIARLMGIGGHGGFIDYTYPSNANYPPLSFHIQTAGLANYGWLLDSYSPAYPPAQLADIFLGQHASSGTFLDDSTPVNLWTFETPFVTLDSFSDGFSHRLFTIDPINNLFGIWNDNFTVSTSGNIAGNGAIALSLFGVGPYPGNLALYSEFQGALCTTNWTLGSTITGGGCTNGQAGDLFGGNNAAFLQAGGLAQLPSAAFISLSDATITADGTGTSPYYMSVTASIPVGSVGGSITVTSSSPTGLATHQFNLTGFNNGCSSVAATMTLVGGSTWTGATSLVTNAGNGCTSNPTQASTCTPVTGGDVCPTPVVFSGLSILTSSTMGLQLHAFPDNCAAQQLGNANAGYFPSVGFQVGTTPKTYGAWCTPSISSQTLTPQISNFGSGVQLKLSQVAVCKTKTGCNPQLITTNAAIPSGVGSVNLGSLVNPTSVGPGSNSQAAQYNSTNSVIGVPASNFDATNVAKRTAKFMGDSQTYSQGGNCVAGGPGTGTCWMPSLTVAKNYTFGQNIGVSGNTWGDQLKTMFQNNTNAPYTGGPMLYSANSTTYAGLGQNDANRFSSFYITCPVNPTAGDTIVVNTSIVTWEVSGASGPNQVNVGGTAAISCTNLLTVLCPTGVVYTGSTPSCGSADANIVKSIYTADVGAISGVNTIRMQPVLSCTALPCSTYSQALSQTGTGALTLYSTLPTSAQIQSAITNQAEFAAVVQTAIPTAAANGGNTSFISAQSMATVGGGATCSAVSSTPWGYPSNYYAMSCASGGSNNALTFTMQGNVFYIGYQGNSTSSTGTFNVSVASGSGTYTLGATTTQCLAAYPVGYISGCLARIPTLGSNGSAQVTISVTSGTVIFVFGASNGNAVGTLDQSDFRIWEAFDSVNNLDSVYDAIRQGERATAYWLGKIDGMPVQDIPVGQQFNCQVNFSQCGGTGQHQSLASIPQFIAPFLGETSGVVFQPSQTATGVGDQTPQGTITGVTAGTGLTGGGTSGIVTLSIGSPLCKLSTPYLNTGNTSLNEINTCTIPAGTMGLNSQLEVDSWSGSCYGIGLPYSACSFLSTVTGVSGGSGFSGSGTLFLTAFNNGCTGTTVTVTMTSGAFTSAVVTAPGTACTTISGLTATCTSGSATCTGSPVTINVTATAGVNVGTCTTKVQFSGTSGAGGQVLTQLVTVAAGHSAHLLGSVSNEGSLSNQIQDGFAQATTSTNSVPIANTVNTASASYLNFYLQNSTGTDQCGLDQYKVRFIP